MSDLVGNPEDRFSHNKVQITTLEVSYTTKAEFTDTVDPDETATNLVLQCLPSSFPVFNIIQFEQNFFL